jgi:hypothetical protein
VAPANREDGYAAARRLISAHGVFRPAGGNRRLRVRDVLPEHVIPHQGSPFRCYDDGLTSWQGRVARGGVLVSRAFTLGTRFDARAALIF